MKIVDFLKIPYYIYRGGVSIVFLLISSVIFGLCGYAMYLFIAKSLDHGIPGVIVLIILFVIGYTGRNFR